MNTKIQQLEIPAWLSGVDLCHHKTQADIAWQVRHELDLYEEGEETDLTARTAALARRFLAKHAPQLLA